MSYRDYSTYYRTMHLKHYLDTLIHWKSATKTALYYARWRGYTGLCTGPYELSCTVMSYRIGTEPYRLVFDRCKRTPVIYIIILYRVAVRTLSFLISVEIIAN